MKKKNSVSILGDSRVFDTYYLNDRYDQGYGYDKTFPHLLRGKLLRNEAAVWDVVHIPDHFRGGTVSSNTLRLALTDPDCVYLCDGIWETLLNKSHFKEYVLNAIDDHQTRDGELSFDYSHHALAQLFVEGKLSISPQKYAKRIYDIASYFIRRRRACVWMNLIMPDPAYKDGVHYAGDYKCSPYWRDCLQAVNECVDRKLAEIGAETFDLDQMMRHTGGEESALLDQWHFTESFHAVIADALYDKFAGPDFGVAVSDDHISHRFMVAPKQISDRIIVFKPDDKQVLEDYIVKPLNVEIVTDDPAAAASAKAEIVLLAADDSVRDGLVRDLLTTLRQTQIIVFPEEISTIENRIESAEGSSRFN